MFYCFRNMCRLYRIKIHRLAFIDSAESTVPGAGIAAKHERGCFVGPAFKNVGALCFLANFVGIQAADQFYDGVLTARVTKFDLQPVRLFKPFTVLSVYKPLN